MMVVFPDVEYECAGKFRLELLKQTEFCQPDQ